MLHDFMLMLFYEEILETGKTENWNSGNKLLHMLHATRVNDMYMYGTQISNNLHYIIVAL